MIGVKGSCVIALALAVTPAGCGDGGAGDADGATIDAAAIADAAAVDADLLRPDRLEDTGLYADFAGGVLADGVRGYTTEHVLWADGATKQRWIWLPPGSTIDTSDMDYWVYPEGTKVWKEFTRDGVRVETRYLSKLPGGGWYAMAYAWNPAQDATAAVPAGATDALGTAHDIPKEGDCGKCHDRGPDWVLGFSAIQLDHTLAGVTLDTLVSESLLSDPPDGTAPFFTIPGDPTTAQALGYLHANCGGCHNPRGDVRDVVPLELRLEVARLDDVSNTPTYQTAVDQDTALTPMGGLTKLVASGDPSMSIVHDRMSRRDMRQMPPLASSDVDAAALAIIDAWISGL
jgi:hypothetical protein